MEQPFNNYFSFCPCLLLFGFVDDIIKGQQHESDFILFYLCLSLFGKNVWCYKHRDVMNCPFGFCAITALGQFDSTKGGNIILWEPKLIIEFPPGSTVLIPSAAITHSNIPVQEGDARVSFTQYCTGGIFRYIDNGFCTQETLKREDPEEYEHLETLKGGQWETGLELLATMDDVKWNT